MYISRLPLNVNRPETLRLVSSSYRMHAAVESSFPPNAIRQSDEGRILWRIDSSSKCEDGAWLYVISPERPDFSHIVEQCGWPSNSEWETKDYGPVLDHVSEGQVWRFRLKANPARKVLVDQGRKENKRVVGSIQGHVTAEQQLEWLLDRTTKHGFEVAKDSNGFYELDVSQRHVERSKRQGQTITISTAVFDGALIVSDAELFRKALGFGIGRAKGFGCGLMTIMPAV